MKLVEPSPPADPTVEALDRIADALRSIGDELVALSDHTELVWRVLSDVAEELKAARTQKGGGSNAGE